MLIQVESNLIKDKHWGYYKRILKDLGVQGLCSVFQESKSSSTFLVFKIEQDQYEQQINLLKRILLSVSIIPTKPLILNDPVSTNCTIPSLVENLPSVNTQDHSDSQQQDDLEDIEENGNEELEDLFSKLEIDNSKQKHHEKQQQQLQYQQQRQLYYLYQQQLQNRYQQQQQSQYRYQYSLYPTNISSFEQQISQFQQQFFILVREGSKKDHYECSGNCQGNSTTGIEDLQEKIVDIFSTPINQFCKRSQQRINALKLEIGRIIYTLMILDENK